MSTDFTRRVFYCEQCGTRCRCLPLHVVVLGAQLGGSRQLIIDLELCPACKLAWIDQHFNRFRPGRKPMHETKLRDARLQPRDVDDLVEVAQWRTVGRRNI